MNQRKNSSAINRGFLFSFLSAWMLNSGCGKIADQTLSTNVQGIKTKDIAATTAIGTGWTEIFPTKKIHLEEANGYAQTFNWQAYAILTTGTADYQYTSSTNSHLFRLIQADAARSEIRLYNEYSTGSRQFEGYVTFYSPSNNQSLMQIYGSTSGATQLMVRAYSNNGGCIGINHVGGTPKFLSNLYGQEIKVNVIHYQEDAGNKIEVYLDNVKVIEFTDNESVTNYMKYGCYGALSTDSASVKWRDIKIYQK